MTDKLLFLLRTKAGSMHWWGQRALILILIPIILYMIFDLAFYTSSLSQPTVLLFIHRIFDHSAWLIFLTNVVLLWHIRSGLETIVEDYVHGEKTKIISILFIRILAIQVMKYLYLCCIIF